MSGWIDKLKRVGFWQSQDEPDLPMPVPSTDNLKHDDREKLCNYIRTAEVVARYKGSSTCRLCGVTNGSTSQSDGKYIWPNGLIHYVYEHHVALPKDFIEHVLNYKHGK